MSVWGSRKREDIMAAGAAAAAAVIPILSHKSKSIWGYKRTSGFRFIHGKAGRRSPLIVIQQVVVLAHKRKNPTTSAAAVTICFIGPRGRKISEGRTEYVFAFSYFFLGSSRFPSTETGVSSSTIMEDLTLLLKGLFPVMELACCCCFRVIRVKSC